jgi:hypothetical protein
MDPYLEDPVLWPGVHDALIVDVRAALNRVLPPDYAANSGERVYVLPPGRSIYPDAIVIEQPAARQTRRAPGGRRRAGAGAGVVSEPPWVVVAEPVRLRESFVEILSLKEGRRVVTVIEVLSPANKAAGAEGFELYREKQSQVLASRTHLMEIDLLRGGAHTVAPPREKLAERGRWDYLVSLHRSDQRWTFQVWPIALRDRLPCIPVPLAQGDADVELDLQAVFDQVYDEGAYSRLVEYASDPPSPLSSEDAAWADALLSEKKLRA